MNKLELKQLIKEVISENKFLLKENGNRINEERKPISDAVYESNKGKVIAYLKGKESAKFTKLISAITELDTKKEELSEQKRDISEKLKNIDTEHEDYDSKIREYVENLFNAEESVQTLSVETISVAATLAKKSEKPEDTYKKKVDKVGAWDKLYELMKSNKDLSLLKMMDDVIAQFTAMDKIEAVEKKRGLKYGVKESLLRENIFKTIIDKIKKFFSSFKIWEKDYKKELNSIGSLNENKRINESYMSTINIIAQEATSLEEFLENVYDEFSNLKKNSKTNTYLKDLYTQKDMYNQSNLKESIRKIVTEVINEENSDNNVVSAINQLESAIKYLKGNSKYHENAIWRLVDCIGQLSIKFPNAMGVKQPTGRGFQICKS